MLLLTDEESATYSADLLEQAKARLSDPAAREAAERSLRNMNAGTWAFHRLIHQHPALRQFLETAAFDPDQMRSASYLCYNPSFVRFVSLPFAQSFLQVSKKALAQQDDYAQLQKLLEFSSFILPEHTQLAFGTIKEHLMDRQRMVAALGWEQFVANESLLDFVFSANWRFFMNELPAECSTERDALLASLLQVLRRFRLDAAPEYLHAVCIKLHQLKMDPALQASLQEYENSFSEPHKPAVVKKKIPAWVFVLAGGVLVVAFGFFLLLHFRARAREAAEPEQRYMDAVANTAASDQLSSSINEHNLKGYFYIAGQQVLPGRGVLLPTGATPIPGVTKLPSEEGNSQMVVHNHTDADALLLYFGSDNLLVNKSSRLVAVYIQKGEEYRFRFQPDFGRFNFVFGHQWVQLEDTAYFPLYKNGETDFTAKDMKKVLEHAWAIRSFFSRTLPLQPWLTHDLVITNIEQQTVASTPNQMVYTLLNERDKNKKYGDGATVDLTLEQSSDDITIRARSSLYVYKSFPTFNPNEFR